MRFQILLTSLGAGSSSITCARDCISCLWGGALSRVLCACSHVEGTCLGTHSELNPITIATENTLTTTRTVHRRVFKSSRPLSLFRSLSCSGVWQHRTALSGERSEAATNSIPGATTGTVPACVEGESVPVEEIRGGYLDHRTDGNAYPEHIGWITISGASTS